MAKRNTVITAMLDGVGEKLRGARSPIDVRPSVRVKCPVEGEVVAMPSYSFHLTAESGSVGVEVSIDQGPWLACRESLGLWWYDWNGFDKGEHEIVARARIPGGFGASSSPRIFTVA